MGMGDGKGKGNGKRTGEGDRGRVKMEKVKIDGVHIGFRRLNGELCNGSVVNGKCQRCGNLVEVRRGGSPWEKFFWGHPKLQRADKVESMSRYV